MIKFLTPSRRGPGPGLRGTADGYSPDIARTSTLRLRLRLCHKYSNLNSSIQMYIMSTNAEYTEMTIAKLLVEASARNQRCLRLCHKYSNLKSSIQMYIMSTNGEYAEMTIAKLLVEASAWNQRCLERMLNELKSIF